MDEVARATRRRSDLRALLRDLRAARDRVPSLDRPAEAVGARGVWTGRAADRLHHDELAPLAAQLRHSLDRAEQHVLAELADAERDVDRATARAEAAG